ncbi:hypothetical protein ANRL4_05135 [Anaerolineae bacterium]|nr:hypothetical protein ANRL4_05135 [Anaerolineae bacterium]
MASRLEDFYALVIGVGDYLHPRFANLPVTVHDAYTIAAILTDQGLCGYPQANVFTLTGEQATAPNIRAATKKLRLTASAKSTITVYFSGHGGRAMEDGIWHTYLCPREADPDNLFNTAVSGVEFSDLIAALPAQRLLVILDACHAGGSADLKTSDGSMMIWKAGLRDDYYESLAQGTGRIVIASSKPEQYSYVRPQGDLSLFTWSLQDALSGKAAVRGDGLVHVLDVFHYVNEVVQDSQSKQTPILKVKDLDLNFPIALDHGGSKTSDAAGRPNPIADLREQIIRDPISGAKALSTYLAIKPEWSVKRNEVDLKRANLERAQHDLDLFGLNSNDLAEKNREIFYLLRVCLEVEHWRG